MPTKFLARFSTAVAIALGVTARVLGNRLNRDQLLGCLVVGAFLFMVSLAFFLHGSLPYRSLGVSDASIRRSFLFSWVCVVYALFEIPIWCLITHRFPPDGFTEIQAVIVSAGLVVSLFGSATPWIILLFRQWAATKRQNELLKQQKDAHEKP
jgi:hypothetical protein